MKFYFNGWDDDLDNLILGENIDNHELLFNKEFLEWCDENDIEAVFESKRFINGALMTVRYSIFTVTNEQYDNTNAKYDSIVFENVDHALLFKLTWL